MKCVKHLKTSRKAYLFREIDIIYYLFLYLVKKEVTKCNILLINLKVY